MNGKIYAMILAGALFATPVFAGEGGEGNNTGCNGQGNPNSPCEPQENGGWHHDKPGVITQVKNINQNTNIAAQTQLQGQKQQQSQEQSQGNSNSIEGDSVKVYAPAPSAWAPALTAAPETCMGSTSVGASGGNGVFGFGLSFGNTWKSDDCELRMFARSLQALGEIKAALALLAQNEKVAAALKEAHGQ